MVPNTPTSLNIIQSLDDLKILLFWKIIRDNNFFMLHAEWNPDIEYTDAQKEELQVAWYKIYDAYYTQCEDSKSKNDLRKDALELELSFRIQRLHGNVQLYGWLWNHRVDLSDEQMQKMVMDLQDMILQREPGLKGKLNMFDTPLESIDKITKLMHSLSNQLNRVADKKDKRVDKAVDNIYKKVASVGAELGLQLNVNEMNCSEWLAYNAMAAQKRAAQQQNIRKKK